MVKTNYWLPRGMDGRGRQKVKKNQWLKSNETDGFEGASQPSQYNCEFEEDCDPPPLQTF
jgi:hypothetical protein